MRLYFSIQGNPATKKNHQSFAVNRQTGKTFLVQSKSYKEYERNAMHQIDSMPGVFWGNAPCNIKAVYYMQTRRKVDLCNLLAATCDILVKAGVIGDDNCSVVVGHDGSRVLYDHDKPRVEIEISNIEEE